MNFQSREPKSFQFGFDAKVLQTFASNFLLNEQKHFPGTKATRARVTLLLLITTSEMVQCIKTIKCILCNRLQEISAGFCFLQNIFLIETQ